MHTSFRNEMANPGPMTGRLVVFDDEPTQLADDDPHVSWELRFGASIELTGILSSTDLKARITASGIYRRGMVAPNLGLAEVAAIAAA